MKEARRFRDQWSFTLEPHHKERTVGPSLTVPDECMSIRQIVERYVRTGRVDDVLIREEGGYADGADFDSPDLSEVSRMDLFDREELLNETKEKIKSSKKFFSDQKKQKEARDLAKSRADADDGVKGPEGPKGSEAPSKDRAKKPGASKARSAAIDASEASGGQGDGLD